MFPHPSAETQSPGRPTTKKVGDRAEEMALEYLEKSGLVLVAKQYRYKQLGEIDLIMRCGDVLVFVEVRCRTNHRFGSPEASIGTKKKANIRRTAQAFLVTRGITNTACRFDVVAIDFVGGSPVLRHLTDCF